MRYENESNDAGSMTTTSLPLLYVHIHTPPINICCQIFAIVWQIIFLTQYRFLKPAPVSLKIGLFTQVYMLEITLAIALITVIAIAIFLYKMLLTLTDKLEEALHGKKSAEVLKGHLFEKLFPWAKDFPFSVENLTPVYHPIDCIHWGEDKITFCELKSGQSQLSSKQKHIKKLVEDKAIEWREFRDA